MSDNNNKKLAETIYGLFSNNQFDQVLTHTTEDVVAKFLPTGQIFEGREGFAQFMQSFKSAFPDIVLELTSQIAGEDHVVSEFIAKGNQTGPLMTPAGEVPATGRYAEWPVCEVWRIRDGKLAELRNYQDIGTMLRQLGLLPEPEAVEA